MNNIKKINLFLLITTIIFYTSLRLYAYTEVGGNITTNTLWTSANSPYVVTSDVNVYAGFTLTIEPGVIVKFNSGRRISSSGKLIAIGEEGNEIIFTSYRDDSIAGDTNNNGPTIGYAGDWQYIRLYSTGVSGSRIEHCIIKYSGGRNQYSAVYKGSIFAENLGAVSTAPIVTD